MERDPLDYFARWIKSIAQFCTLLGKVVDDHGNKEEETLHKQCDIEDEVLEYYETLYKHRDVEHTENEISDCIGKNIKKISEN